MLSKSLLAAGTTLMALALALPAIAQTSPDTAETSSDTQVLNPEQGQGQGGAASTLPSVVGAPSGFQATDSNVVGAPAGPQVEAETFQDWRLECYDPAVNGMRCQIVQQLVERNLEQVVLLNSLVYVPSTEQTQIQMVLPTGFLLKRGVTFEIAGYNTTVAVDRCTPQGCFIEGIAAPELLTAMRRARDAQVSIIADTGQTVRIPFSLMGFTDAYAEMTDRNVAYAQQQAAAAAEEEQEGEPAAN